MEQRDLETSKHAACISQNSFVINTFKDAFIPYRESYVSLSRCRRAIEDRQLPTNTPYAEKSSVEISLSFNISYDAHRQPRSVSFSQSVISVQSRSFDMRHAFVCPSRIFVPQSQHKTVFTDPLCASYPESVTHPMPTKQLSSTKCSIQVFTTPSTSPHPHPICSVPVPQNHSIRSPSFIASPHIRISHLLKSINISLPK